VKVFIGGCFIAGINSIKDLANQREIKYGTVRNSAVQKFFETQVTDPYVKMAAYMAQEDTYVNNATYGIDLVRNPQDHNGKFIVCKSCSCNEMQD
jgi:hypothetical protein